MDPNALAGMAFTLVLTLMIGGFILMYPLTKRLGALLDSRMRNEKNMALPAEDLRRLTESLHALEEEVRALRERQEFAEKLIGAREQDRHQLSGARRSSPPPGGSDVPQDR